jgi:hypothetical protein
MKIAIAVPQKSTSARLPSIRVAAFDFVRAGPTRGRSSNMSAVESVPRKIHRRVNWRGSIARSDPATIAVRLGERFQFHRLKRDLLRQNDIADSQIAFWPETPLRD